MLALGGTGATTGAGRHRPARVVQAGPPGGTWRPRASTHHPPQRPWPKAVTAGAWCGSGGTEEAPGGAGRQTPQAGNRGAPAQGNRRAGWGHLRPWGRLRRDRGLRLPPRGQAVARVGTGGVVGDARTGPAKASAPPAPRARRGGRHRPGTNTGGTRRRKGATNHQPIASAPEESPGPGPGPVSGGGAGVVGGQNPAARPRANASHGRPKPRRLRCGRPGPGKTEAKAAAGPGRPAPPPPRRCRRARGRIRAAESGRRAWAGKGSTHRAAGTARPPVRTNRRPNTAGQARPARTTIQLPPAGGRSGG